jgi:uridine phosphorylase
VEQGRWGYKGREFASSRHFSPHRIRRDNVEFHKTSLRQNRGYATEQGKVWAHVADMSHKMAAPTNTGAMNDVLEQRESSLDEYRKGISLVAAETGAAFFVNGIFQGIELFDRLGTFGKMFPKLLSGVAVEAMMARGEKLSARRAKTPAEAADYVKKILAEVSKSLFEKFEPVGVGEDWRYDGKRSFGKALHYGADLIHFSAFGK